MFCTGLLSQLKSGAQSAQKGYQNYQRTQQAIDAVTPKNQTNNVSAPQRRQNVMPQPLGGKGEQATDPPPNTPYSQYDPVWAEWLKRHPQGASYG